MKNDYMFFPDIRCNDYFSFETSSFFIKNFQCIQYLNGAHDEIVPLMWSFLLYNANICTAN